jgi:hypothetical protein
MNIFIYDNDIKTNAQYYPNSHLIKIQLEVAQMLSTTYRILMNYDGDKVYKSTHSNHPCSLFMRASYENYKYCLDLYYALHDEWNYRYQHDKIHASFEVVNFIEENLKPLHFQAINRTPFALAMDEKYRCNDPVKSYRDYFIAEKMHLAKWKNRAVPGWVVM